MTTATDTYALGNERSGTAAMLDCLSDVLDAGTRDLLAPLAPADGRCLELGAGNGSIAGWLAETTSSLVVATDLRPDHIHSDVLTHPRIQVVQHDLRIDPLPAGPFDLIHARLLFAHLANREELLARVAGLLAPGGSLVIEDWGMVGPAEVLSSPWADTVHLYRRYQQALISVFAAAGNDPKWCTRTHATMLRAGLSDVRTTLTAACWRGGEAGCRLPIAVSGVLADQLADRGMDPSGLATLREHWADPRVVLLGNLTWSTIGRRA
jgi:SAM-dependent methyltransferase